MKHAILKPGLSTSLMCLGLLCLLAGPATALDVGGTHYQDSVAVGPVRLQLNGAGVQGAAGAYAAGLYLEQKAVTQEEALGSSGVKQLEMVMLRDLDSAELAALLVRGTQDNVSDEQLATMLPVYFELGRMLGEQKQFKAGDSIQLRLIPTLGTVISINGRPQGEPLPQAAAFDGMLRIWLGGKPVDAPLKRALLGQPV
jgi:hypothetical protein